MIRILAIVALALAPAQEPPSIRVTTRLVQVGVIVLDAKGRPVEGLTKDDFTLLDKNVPQRIQEFSVVSEKSAPPRQPLAPGLFTNDWQFKPQPPAANATVILFDALNTPFADQAYARQQLLAFLGQLRSHDRVALYSLGAQVRILHEFTDDPASLARAARRVEGRTPLELDAQPAESTNNESFDLWIQETSQRLIDFYTINRVQTTLVAMEAIARHVAQLPGRKNLIWISGSFPISIGLDEPFQAQEENQDTNSAEQRLFAEEMERTARVLNQANIAIYPVDARGLVLNSGFRATQADPSLMRDTRRNPLVNVTQTQSSMAMIAERTGGRAYYNRNDISNAIRQAMDESRVTYILGFYPVHNQWDGSWRQLKVRVKKQGVQVRHRVGYVAFAEEKLPPSQKIEERLLAALQSPLEATELTLAAHCSLAGPDKLHVLLRVSPDKVLFKPSGGKFTGGFDIHYVSVPGKGKPEVQAGGFDFDLDKAQLNSIFKKGFLIERTLALSPETERLKIIVRDRESGSIGTLDVRLAGIPVAQTGSKKR
jgi:VWFA-related protein